VKNSTSNFKTINLSFGLLSGTNLNDLHVALSSVTSSTDLGQSRYFVIPSSSPFFICLVADAHAHLDLPCGISNSDL